MRDQNFPEYPIPAARLDLVRWAESREGALADNPCEWCQPNRRRVMPDPPA